MTERLKHIIINHYILARYLLPIVLVFNTASLVLRYGFDLDDATRSDISITVATFGFLLLSPIVLLLFPRIKLPGKPITHNELLIYLFWIVILISLKIWIKASSY